MMEMVERVRYCLLMMIQYDNIYRQIQTIYKRMLLYYLKRRKNTESKTPKVARTKKRRVMLLSKFAVCDRNKSKLIKQQGASGLLSSLGIKTPF